MESRIKELIESLNLMPHPEGGYYAETYRSEDVIATKHGERNLMTVIYFLLTSKDVSRFHVIQSDEHWFHHEGADLSIHILDESGHHTLKLGLKSIESKPQHVVYKGKIFGSSVDEEHTYALVSCVVAPGFDFSDFKLFSKKELLLTHPNHEKIIEKLGL